VFFAYASWLSWKIIKIMKLQYMVALNISMAWIYGLVFAGFLLMTFRAVQVAVTHWRRGYSCLDYRPEENALS
jgi:TRAP-type C4-dicarboxylate transport system permease small subunit